MKGVWFNNIEVISDFGENSLEEKWDEKFSLEWFKESIWYEEMEIVRIDYVFKKFGYKGEER